MPANPLRLALLLAAFLGAFAALPTPAIAGSTPGDPGSTAAPGTSADSTLAAEPVPPAQPPAPLFVDPADAGFGTSLVFRRLPTAADIAGLSFYDNIQHLVIALPAWPDDFGAMESLAQLVLPEGADVVVLLPGYPASRGQLRLWDMVRRPLRVILMVDGPPEDRGMIVELNSMRSLERVIATMPRPEHTGFERLQRPLAFRVVMP